MEMMKFYIDLNWGFASAGIEFEAASFDCAKKIHEKIRALAPSGVQVRTYGPGFHRENRATGPDNRPQNYFGDPDIMTPQFSPKTARAALTEWIGH
jgi:hypothetical protein